MRFSHDAIFTAIPTSVNLWNDSLIITVWAKETAECHGVQTMQWQDGSWDIVAEAEALTPEVISTSVACTLGVEAVELIGV
jgi:hypothetical protein